MKETLGTRLLIPPHPPPQDYSDEHSQLLTPMRGGGCIRNDA